MKSLIFIYYLLTVFSCNPETSSSKVDDIKSTDLTVSDNADIFGNWTMCATSENGAIYQMNNCAIVVFNKNGTGRIERNSIISETFTWKLKTPSLVINSSKNSEFSDTFYYATITKRDGRIDFILNHNDKKYYLSK